VGDRNKMVDIHQKQKKQSEQSQRIRHRTQPKKGIFTKGIVIQICLCMIPLIGVVNYSQLHNLKKLSHALSYVLAGASVLTNFNSQYLILYLRPDLQVIPSCELGFPNRKILKEYIDYFNNNKVVDLIRKTKTEYFISSKQPEYEENNFFILLYKDNDLKVKIWKYKTSQRG